MKNFMILFVTLAVSTSCYSSEYTSYGTIERLRLGTNGDSVFVHEDQSRNPQNCSRTEEYRVARSLVYYQDIYSMLLSAYMNQARVRVYISGCEKGYPRVIAAALDRE